MKRLILVVFGALVLTLILAFTSLNKHLDLNYVYLVGGKPTVRLQHTDDNFIPSYGKSFIGFKEDLAIKESQGRYHVVNTLGYLGRYQFGKNTLALMRIKNSTNFLNKPKLQEKAFLAYLSYNKWLLKDEIQNYIGKTVNNILVTESGILAAAHLAGAGNVKKFFASKGIKKVKDAYGTSIEDYMRKFSNYDLSDVEAVKYPRIHR